MHSMAANTMNHDQTAPREQSDLGSYFLQYMLPRNVYKQISEQTAIVMMGRKGVKRDYTTSESSY